MKKLIPAVFFQKQVTGSSGSVQKPERLEMFENELDQVVGGVRRHAAAGGSDTFSYSAGWLDVEQADDCSA